MEKRGQVYLLAAIIIGLVLFILVMRSNVVEKTVIEDDFEELAKNYEIESAKFVNGLMEKNYPPKKISEEFLKFTIIFTSYSKTKNPDFGLIYAFVYNDRLYLGNYLNENIEIKGVTEVKGCYKKVKTKISVAGLEVPSVGTSLGTFTQCKYEKDSPGNFLEIIIEGITYKIELTKDHPEIIIVSRETKDKQRKVYVKGKFI